MTGLSSTKTSIFSSWAEVVERFLRAGDSCRKLGRLKARCKGARSILKANKFKVHLKKKPKSLDNKIKTLTVQLDTKMNIIVSFQTKRSVDEMYLVMKHEYEQL